MKKILVFLMAAVAAMTSVSCGAQKRLLQTQTQTSAPAQTSAPQAPAEVSREQVTSLEGETVVREKVQIQGIEMSESLNEDGTEIIKRPFKWYAGTAKADNKQIAIELAQREAYATISRIISDVVKDKAEKGGVMNNDNLQQAITSHWEQVSMSIQKGCEPYGTAVIEYSPSTRMYEVTAKVAIRGDRFNQLLNSAGNFKPADLTGEELDKFIEANKAIMAAAKGNN